jgi:tetratricopeptide (TPR) repeat protein
MDISWRLAMAVLLILLSVIFGSACDAAEKAEKMEPLTTWVRALDKYQTAGQFVADEEWKSALRCLAEVWREFPPPYSERAIAIARKLRAAQAISPDQEDAETERFRALARVCESLESYAGAVKYYRAALKLDSKNGRSDLSSLVDCMRHLNATQQDFEALLQEFPQPEFRDSVRQAIGDFTTRRYVDNRTWEPIQAVVKSRSLTNLQRLADAAAKSTFAEHRAGAYQLISSRLYRGGDYAGAEAWEEKLLTEMPGAVDQLARLYYDRADKLQQEKNWVDAARWYRKVADEFPKTRESDEARMTLARALFNQGKLLEAQRECQKLLDEPIVPDVRFAGFGEKEFGEVKVGMRAREPLHEAATLVSGIHELNGNLVEALKFARLAHEEYPSSSWCGTCAAQSEAAARKRVAVLRKKINDERIKRKKGVN